MDDAHPGFLNAAANMTGSRSLLDGMRLVGRGAYKYKKKTMSRRPTVRRSYAKTRKRAGPSGTRNNLFGTSPTRVQRTKNNESNEIVIENKEYISELTPGDSLFKTLFSSNVNPGLPSVFPWLSNIAQFYEEYDFQQLVFEMRSMVTSGNTNSQGSLIMCCQYNPDNALFTSKSDMEQYEHSISSKVTSNCSLGVECNPKYNPNKSLYIRTGAVGTQDLKQYDLGVVQIATQGAYPNLNVGELWVTYKVVLRKAKVPPVGMISNSKLANAGVNVRSVAATLVNAQTGIAVVPTNINWLGFPNTTTTYSMANIGEDTTNASQAVGSGFTIRYTGDNSQAYRITFPPTIVAGVYMVTAGVAHANGTNPVGNVYTNFVGCAVAVPPDPGFYGTGGTVTSYIGMMKLVVNTTSGVPASFSVAFPWLAPQNVPAANNDDTFIQIVQLNTLPSVIAGVGVF